MNYSAGLPIVRTSPDHGTGYDIAGQNKANESSFRSAVYLACDVFRTRNMRGLPGTVGLGQVRYPTAGNAFSEEEAQPFYVNAPYGIVLVHNGNLTNAAALKDEAVATYFSGMLARRLTAKLGVRDAEQAFICAMLLVP